MGGKPDFDNLPAIDGGKDKGGSKGFGGFDKGKGKGKFGKGKGKGKDGKKGLKGGKGGKGKGGKGEPKPADPDCVGLEEMNDLCKFIQIVGSI